MSESIENGRSAFLRPFSFEKWASEETSSHSVNFTEKYLKQYAVRVEQNDRDGALDPVDNRDAKALFWSGLAELDLGRGHDVEVDAWLDASEHVDVLLERSKVSYQAASYLEALALQLYSGLTALAANGNKDAAFFLVLSLYESIEEFNMLARHKPVIFREIVRDQDGIPGIITPHVEKTDTNANLVKYLEVAVDYPIKLPTKRGKGRQMSVLNTARNLWALRLLKHIASTHILVQNSNSDVITDGLKTRSWLRGAKELSPFSAATWRSWAVVAWDVVMEATANHPEREKALIDLQTVKSPKISKRTGQPLKKTIKATQKEIREAIFRGFEALSGDNMPAA